MFELYAKITSNVIAGQEGERGGDRLSGTGGCYASAIDLSKPASVRHRLKLATCNYLRRGIDGRRL